MKAREPSARMRLAGCLSCVLIIAVSGCTLRLEDHLAPSVQVDIETQYEVARWGDRRIGFVPPPPAAKKLEARRTGTGFQLRARISNTFTWTNPEGAWETDYWLNGTHHFSNSPVEAEGWRYRGRLSVLPGLSLSGDRLFLCPIFFGVEGTYLGVEIRDKGAPSGDWADFYSVGIPLGFHVEWTIAHAVTPYFTFAYVANVYSGAEALPGYDVTFQIGGRLWPAALIPSLGRGLWIDVGWLWTVSKGISDPIGLLQKTDFEIGGPVLGLGWRF